LQNILEGFRRDNLETARRIRRAREDGNRDGLRHLAHSLKGSAGNIGAGALRQAAADLEEGCASLAAEELGRLAETLCAEVQRVVTLLTAMPPAICPEPTCRPRGTDVGELLAGLAEAIDRADPEEIGKISNQLQGLLTTQSGRDRAALETLLAETARYDYDQARHTLTTMLQHDRHHHKEQQ
jgi:HPt (histidine-containing phosphotransfer) domain-containing protein